jgi:hypothetical protein
MSLPFKIKDKGIQGNFDYLAAKIGISGGNVASGIVQAKTYTMNNVSSINLGAIDGDNITGVRISFHGRVVLATSATDFLCIRPNGLTSITGQYMSQIAYWASPGAANASAWGNDNLPMAGLPVCETDFVSTAGQINHVSGHGTFLTNRLAASTYRHYIGEFLNNDGSINGSRFLHGRMGARWHDSTTPITSLSFAWGNGGSFIGRVVMEILP